METPELALISSLEERLNIIKANVDNPGKVLKQLRVLRSDIYYYEKNYIEPKYKPIKKKRPPINPNQLLIPEN